MRPGLTYLIGKYPVPESQDLCAISVAFPIQEIVPAAAPKGGFERAYQAVVSEIFHMNRRDERNPLLFAGRL